MLFAAFYRQSQGWSVFQKTLPRGRFLVEIRIRCSTLPATNAKKDNPFVPFSGRLVKIFLPFAPIRTIFAITGAFNFPLHRATVTLRAESPLIFLAS